MDNRAENNDMVLTSIAGCPNPEHGPGRSRPMQITCNVFIYDAGRRENEEIEKKKNKNKRSRVNKKNKKRANTTPEGKRNSAEDLSVKQGEVPAGDTADTGDSSDSGSSIRTLEDPRLDGSKRMKDYSGVSVSSADKKQAEAIQMLRVERLSDMMLALRLEDLALSEHQKGKAKASK